jgi:DNA-binding PadR family transcriptional regulator
MTTEKMVDLFSLAGDALRALGTRYDAALRQANVELGLEGHDWGILFAAQGLEPQPIAAALLQSFSPYVTLETLDSQLAEAAGRGLLAGDAAGGYRLTERGRAAVRQSFGAVHAALAHVEPLPAGDMRRLNELLRRLVDATLAAPEPDAKPALLASRLTDPGAHASAAALADQHLTDLVRFRDDAHVAAWRPYGTSGIAWEALTLIWRGEAYSPDTLAKRLERRSLPAHVYLDAIHDLIERGWVAQHGEVYRLTDRGASIRQQAETATDRYFYAPWACLSEVETEELSGLLERLRDCYPQEGGESTG